MSRPRVLLHGFTGSAASWAHVLEELDAGPGEPTVLAPAVLGHDGTPGPAEIDTFEAEVDRLADVIRGGTGEGAHLVGYSMGGRLALGLLVRHPGLFDSATLIGASPGLRDPGERETRAARDEEWARLLDVEGLDTFVAAWEALPLWATQATVPAARLDRQRRIRRSHDPRGLARSLRVVGLGRMPDYRPHLGQVDIPVRLVAGTRDPKFLGLARAMADRLPRAMVIAVPEAGHNVVLERPEEIAGLLREDRSP